MKRKVIPALMGAILLAAVLLGACSAPAWGPAEREELGEPQLVAHKPDGPRQTLSPSTSEQTDCAVQEQSLDLRP